MPTTEIKAAVEESGKFQILEQFTEGQSAYSFKAHHVHLNREVFLKLYDYSESMANDVLREPRTIVEAMRLFRSENVVELFDAEVLEVGKDNYLCLQMEFVFALNMRNALPNAAFIGFTGTPLITGEELTKQIFGDYISIYNFKQSIYAGMFESLRLFFHRATSAVLAEMLSNSSYSFICGSGRS